MSVEMACGNCEGRFVATAAGTVACPHCGTHVTIAEADVTAAAERIPQPAEDEQETIQQLPVAEALQPSGELFAGYAGLVDDEWPASGESQSGESGFARGAAAVDAQDSTGDEATITLPPDSAPSSEMEATIPDFSEIDVDERAGGEASFDFGEEQPTLAYPGTEPPHPEEAGDEPAFAAAGGESLEAAPDFGELAIAGEQQDELQTVFAAAGTAAFDDERPDSHGEPQPFAETRPPQSSTGETKPVVSRTWFLLLASYASAVTIVCLWLLSQLLSGGGQLENLADPAETLGKGDKKRVQLVPVAQQLPRGHILKLGESRRFGNIVVEPQKVTRGPLQFEHFSEDEKEEGDPKPPTAAVLKLWLRFENGSTDQEIAPLDSILLYENRFHDKKDFDKVRGNTFVYRAEESGNPRGKVVYAYALNMNDNWNVRGQPLPTLTPGDSVVTFVPAGPAGIDDLTGDLIWRVHLRKGYSASNRGLTTLFEVRFHSDDIRPEPTAPAADVTAAR